MRMPDLDAVVADIEHAVKEQEKKEKELRRRVMVSKDMSPRVPEPQSGTDEPHLCLSTLPPSPLREEAALLKQLAHTDESLEWIGLERRQHSEMAQASNCSETDPELHPPVIQCHDTASSHSIPTHLSASFSLQGSAKSQLPDKSLSARILAAVPPLQMPEADSCLPPDPLTHGLLAPSDRSDMPSSVRRAARKWLRIHRRATAMTLWRKWAEEATCQFEGLVKETRLAVEQTDQMRTTSQNLYCHRVLSQSRSMSGQDRDVPVVSSPRSLQALATAARYSTGIHALASVGDQPDLREIVSRLELYQSNISQGRPQSRPSLPRRAARRPSVVQIDEGSQRYVRGGAEAKLDEACERDEFPGGTGPHLLNAPFPQMLEMTKDVTDSCPPLSGEVPLEIPDRVFKDGESEEEGEGLQSLLTSIAKSQHGSISSF